ncbi:MAG TPA: NYN domain-containing protein [Thermoanaerobaculia bacterium]|jgi:predicted RNA-binding protein with PIN domain|nr:NYN domain-containing protein [Thermoanaerobaculia bacterium]
MPYVLDGNNLIGSVRRASRPSEADRQALVAEVAERLRRTRARATIVFDGPSGSGGGLGTLTVRGAGPEGADEMIVRAVAAARSPAEMIVVTADRELARRVRDAGGKVCAPPDFFRRFGAGETDAPRPAPGHVDVDEWTAWFGDEENRWR